MTDSILKKISELEQQARAEMSVAQDSKTLETLRVKYLGKKGEVTAILRSMGTVSAEDRPTIGQKINELNGLLEAELETSLKKFKGAEQSVALLKDQIDISLPGRGRKVGKLHPLTQVMEEIVSVFKGLGFSIHHGPEIETDFYNFEALNVSADHPARDMQDTFYVEDGRLLRTHTSPVQIHVMQNQKPPIAMIAPGSVYRRDNDVSHSPMFHQVEGLLVDENINFGHLKSVLSIFCRELFGENCAVRFRPSFFPFTEPSAELDIGCFLCAQKGCRVCKGSGWVEIMGCGMVDPEVFKAVDYDASKLSGFAFGMGVERIAMLKYQISDIRLFYENDIRFLEQF